MASTRGSSLSRRSVVAGGLALAREPAPVRLPRKVRIALLGMEGHTAEILRPLPMLPDVEVAAVSGASPEAVARFARNPRLAGAKPYQDYRRMLDNEKLDLVAVCNPNGERAAGILECLSRKLHVVAEKPLAIEMADLERVKKAVAASGKHIGTLLPMRYSPPYLALKKLVDSGEVGEVAQIGAQKSYKAGQRPAWMLRRESYGGTMAWIGIHMVDLMRFTSGREMVEVASYQARIGFPQMRDMENTTGTLFRLDNGGVAALRMDYFRPESAPTHGDDRLRLAGTKGVAEYQQATGVTLLTAGRKPEVIRDLPAERSLFVEFLDAVYNGKPFTLTEADIFRTNEIVLRAREAAEKGAILKI